MRVMKLRVIHALSAGVLLALAVGLLLIPSITEYRCAPVMREAAPHPPQQPKAQQVGVPQVNFPILFLSITIIAVILLSFKFVSRIEEKSLP